MLSGYLVTMALPQAADRGGGAEIWRVATNMMNKQSRIVDNGWSSSLGVERGVTTHYKNELVTKYLRDLII